MELFVFKNFFSFLQQQWDSNSLASCSQHSQFVTIIFMIPTLRLLLGSPMLMGPTTDNSMQVSNMQSDDCIGKQLDQRQGLNLLCASKSEVVGAAFVTIICCKILFILEKTKNKQNRGWGWPISRTLTLGSSFVSAKTHHRGKCHCSIYHLFDWFGFGQTSKAVLHSEQQLNSNKMNMSAVQRYFPLNQCSLVTSF